MRVVHPPPRRPRSRGLTLVELLITIAIVGILTGLAAPSMQDFLIRNRSAAMANELTASVLRARNEAVNANACVVMCRVQAPVVGGQRRPLGPEPACVAGTDWSTGWVAFREPGCNAASPGPSAADGRPVVAAGGPFAAGYTLVKGGANTDRIVFSPAGHVRAGDAGRFDLRYGTTTRDSNRGLCLNPLGRTRPVPFGAAC